MSNDTARERLFNELQPWLETVRAYPGFLDWKKRSISRTLGHGDGFEDAADEPAREFVFSDDLEKQHAGVMAFFGLYETQAALEDCQFYFRRYPFFGLPVSRSRHLRYCCEMYFSRIYEFRERLKKCLNAVQPLAGVKIDVGALLKTFDRDFKRELVERNGIHHHTSYDDILLDKLRLLDMMSGIDKRDGGDRGFKWVFDLTYRRACREWSERVKKRSTRTGDYLNATAEFILTECGFVREAKNRIEQSKSGGDQA